MPIRDERRAQQPRRRCKAGSNTGRGRYKGSNTAAEQGIYVSDRGYRWSTTLDEDAAGGAGMEVEGIIGIGVTVVLWAVDRWLPPRPGRRRRRQRQEEGVNSS